MSERFFGLIPAAGAGERMGQAMPKQYLPILGRPMLYHAVRGMLGSGKIESVFVVLAPGDQQFREHDWSEFGRRVAPLYCGGPTRRDSVLNGLVAISASVQADEWILVHDAARPCLGKRELERMILALAGDEAGGLLAVPVADTLKRADAAGRVLATESREYLWQAQTPQMFRLGLLLHALELATRVTDEAGAIEAMGLKPKLVPGSSANLKVTYPEDLQLAETILASQGKQA